MKIRLDWENRIPRNELRSWSKKNCNQETFDWACTELMKEDSDTLLNASFVFSDIIDAQPHLGYAWIEKLTNFLETAKTGTVKRVVFRYFEKISFSEEIEGKVLEVAFNHFVNPKNAIAIKVFAMTTCYNISQKYPELLNELAAEIKYQLPHGSTGFKSRANKILKSISKLI